MHELILQENYLLVQLFIFNLIYIAFPAPRVPPARVFETPWAPGISPSEDATRCGGLLSPPYGMLRDTLRGLIPRCYGDLRPLLLKRAPRNATRSPKKCKRKENMMNPFQRSKDIFKPSSIPCNSASSKLPSFSINLDSEMERT